MKHALIAALALSALTACGGGGSSPSPVPVVTTAPKTYSSKLIFTGSLAGRAIQSDLRRAMDASGTATPMPIMVVSPVSADMDASAYGGLVEAVVSPMPSAAPDTTFSQTNPNAVLHSPAPGETTPSGAVAFAQIFGANTPEQQSAGTATASIASPVNQSPSTPVYSYLSIDLECAWSFTSTPGTNAFSGAHFGWKYNGSQWIGDDNAADADIYLDGPGCSTTGSQNTSEANATIHIPGGDIRFSTDTPFVGLTASQWSSAETSFDLLVADTVNGDGSQNTVVIGKTRDGAHTFKLFPNSFGPTAQYFGAIEVSGAGVDGF